MSNKPVERRSSRVKVFTSNDEVALEKQLNRWLTADDGTWNLVHDIQYVVIYGSVSAFVHYTPE